KMETSNHSLRFSSTPPKPCCRRPAPTAPSPSANETAAYLLQPQSISQAPSDPAPHSSSKTRKSPTRTNTQIDPTSAATKAPMSSPHLYAGPQTNNSAQAGTAPVPNPAAPSAPFPAAQSLRDNFRVCIRPNPNSIEFPVRSAAAAPPFSTSAEPHPNSSGASQ